MNGPDRSIRQTLLDLKGKPAWGLHRTYGSVFFGEVGKQRPLADERQIHGEWHFLVEVCQWRFDSQDAIFLGSDDQQPFIDDNFLHLELGLINVADVCHPSNDLRIAFSSGVVFRTFSTAAASADPWTQWHLYCPDDGVWTLDAIGRLTCRNAYT